VLQRNAHDLDPILVEQNVGRDQQRLSALPSHFRDRVCQFPRCGGFDEDRLEAERPARLFELFARGAKIWVRWILQHSDVPYGRQQLAKHLKALGIEVRTNDGIAGDIAAGLRKTRDKTRSDGIGRDREYDRYGVRSTLGRQRGGRAARHDELNLEANKLLRQGAK